MAIQNFQRTKRYLVSSIYGKARHGWAWNSFQNIGSQTAGKRHFEYGCYK